MIITASSPWKNQASARWRNLVVIMLLFLGLVASFSAIFSSSSATAQVNRSDQCQSFTIIGDHQGVQDVRAGLEDKIREDLGVRDVESQAFNGRNVNQITNQIKNSNLSGRCLIIEGGTGDLKNDKKSIEDDLKEAVRELNSSGANKIFWVSPVVDDARAGRDYQTKRFNDALRNIDGGKINVINIQELSVRGPLFKDNGVTMTDEGYQERVNLIMKKIKPLVDDPKDTPSSSSPSSSTPSGSPSSSNPGSGSGNAPGSGSGSTPGAGAPPAPGPGGSGGEGGPEFSGSGPNPSGAESGAGTKVDDDHVGDITKSSPLSFANEIENYGRSNSSQFLIVNRWGGFDIAAPDFRPDSIADSLMGSMSAMISNMYFNIAQFIFSVLTNGLMLVVGDSLPTIGIKIANSVFAGFVGGSTGNRERMIPIATGLATIAFVFSFLTAIDTKTRMTPKQRVMHVASSVLKVMFATMFFLFIAYQSSKNHDPSYTSDLVEEIKNEEGQDIDFENTRGTERERRAGDFSTWEPFSMGWFLSLGYYLGNQVASAAFNIGSAIVIYPMESISSSMEEHLQSGEGIRPACDRYIDSINLAFRGTQFAQGSPALSSTLSALDFTYAKLVIKPYSYLWGGATIQQGNSYCRDLEISASRQAGEILLMARGAGLWKEAAGSGNIIKSDRVELGKYANGKHISSSNVSNLSDGLPTGQNGALVDAAGNWQAGSDKEYNTLNRARHFIEGGRSKSVTESDPGLYYFANCIWQPKEQGSFLDGTLKGAPAMGATGVAEAEENLPPYEVEIGIDDKFKERASTSQGIIGGVPPFGPTSGKANDLLDSVAGEENGKDKKIKIPSPNKKTMYNSDCQNPFVFYLDNVSSDALTGWNSMNQWAERWDFTPTPPPSLLDSIKASASGAASEAAKNIPGYNFYSKLKNGIEQVKESVEEAVDEASEDQVLKPIDPEKNPRIDPEASLSTVVDSNGHNSAKAFWEYRAGLRTDGTSLVVAGITMLVSAAMLALFFVPVLLLAIVNLVFTVFLVIAGGILALNLILMAFRSGKPKDAR